MTTRWRPGAFLSGMKKPKRNKGEAMKIEVGKLYLDRAGRKVRIYAVDGRQPNPIHGATLKLSGWDWLAWHADGRWSPSGKEEYDIVSEWIEPKPKLRAWITGNGTVQYLSPEVETYREYDGNMCKRAPWLDEPEGQ